MSEKAKGPYFLGDAFSMVDVVLAPWVIRDYILKEHRGYAREAVGGGWKEYADALSARESVLKTQSVSDLFALRLGGIDEWCVGPRALRADLWAVPARRSPERGREGYAGWEGSPVTHGSGVRNVVY